MSMNSKKIGIVCSSRWKNTFAACAHRSQALFILVIFASLIIGTDAYGAKPQSRDQEAQKSTNSDIVGQVSGTEGAPLSRVTVIAEDLATHQKFQAVSDSTGSFSLKGLPAGEYSIRATADGFKQFVIRKIPLVAGDEAKATVRMQPGNASEVVEGGANSIVSRAGTSLAGKELSDIPQNQRNFVNLVQLSGGANEGNTNGSGSGAKPGAQHSSSSVSVGGQLETLNNAMIDGIDNNERINSEVSVHPSVDAIGGMQISASAYPATQGRAGGGVIDITSKSGTKKLHGSIYEYFRNDDLDAYPYLFGAHTSKPEVRQNQYGGSLGGPLWKGGKTTFFGNYEGFRLIQGRSPVLLTVPTTYEHNNPGDFTDITGGTKLTSAQLDSAGLQYFKLYPYPNSGTSTYVSAPSGSDFAHAGGLRVDHQFSPKDMFFARFTYDRSATGIPSAFPDVTEDGITIRPGGQLYTFAGNNLDTALNTIVSYTHVFSPHMNLDLKAGYTQWVETDSDLNPNNAVNEIFGQSNINVTETSNGLAPISMGTAAPLGNSGYFRPLTQVDNAFTYKGNLSWTVGHHNMSIGAGLIRRQFTYGSSMYSLGYWTVSDLPSLLKGEYTASTRSVNLDIPHYRTWEPSIYFEDEWHVFNNFTLSWGVRYDIFTPPTEIKNRLSNFDSTTGNIIVAGQNGVSKTADVNTDHSGIVPRVGFNWAPIANVSIHGGFGIVASPAADGSVFMGAPYTYTYGTCSSTTCATGYQKLADGLPVITTPSTTNPSGTMEGVRAKKLKNMSMDQFNLGIDYSLSQHDTAHVTYVGSLGRHISREFPDLNAPSPNASSTPNTYRPYYSIDPNLTTLAYTDSGGSSSYNALQASYSHIVGYGLTATVNYTMSHGLDNARPWGFDTTGYGSVISDSNTRDYGNSDFDVRHHITSTVMYELPFGIGATGWKKTVEKGWQMNVMEIWGTGLPFTVLNVTDMSGTNPGAYQGDRPNVTGKPNLSNKSTNEFFDTSAFTAQTSGTLGNERRNQYYGPHSRHTDVSLFKTFQMSEGKTVQFRTECFNVTNTANFAAPANTLGGANFGQLTQITTGYTPREIQFALRLQF
jgi:hypothetical protein